MGGGVSLAGLQHKKKEEGEGIIKYHREGVYIVMCHLDAKTAATNIPPPSKINGAYRISYHVGVKTNRGKF